MEKIIIAKILKPQGLKGQVKVKVYSDDLNFFDVNNMVTIKDSGEKLKIIGNRQQKGFVYLDFQSLDVIEKVEYLRGKELTVEVDDLKQLNEDEYFIKDLLGCSVYNQKEELLGKIKNIDSYGSADVYTIKNRQTEMLFAFVEGLFDKVDLENKKVIVNDKLFSEVVV